jgi:hypothetical protein
LPKLRISHRASSAADGALDGIAQNTQPYCSPDPASAAKDF